MGNYDKHFWGSREQRKKISGSREHELKTFLRTRGFISGEQGIKSKTIKGLWEHVPPWEGLTIDNKNSVSIPSGQGKGVYYLLDIALTKCQRATIKKTNTVS